MTVYLNGNITTQRDLDNYVAEKVTLFERECVVIMRTTARRRGVRGQKKRMQRVPFVFGFTFRGPFPKLTFRHHVVRFAEFQPGTEIYETYIIKK